jgi:hypothetical protein
MIGRARHLRDDRLYECFLADRDGAPVDPPAADHLARCAACGARYTELVEFFSSLGAEGTREADAVFTPERLHEQRDHVLRRVEHLNRAARVISFPGRAPHHMTGASTRVAPRWLAAAAAAGLFVGVAVGGVFSQPRTARSSAPLRVSSGQSAGGHLAPQPADLVNYAVVVTDGVDDERLLMELEVALERPHTRELQPFDALMPRAREIGSQVR